MSPEKLRLEVLLAAIDKATGPLKAIAKGSGETARALKAARDEAKRFGDQRGMIAAFKDADKAAAITANQFKTVQERVRLLKEEMAKTPEPTQKMVRALKDAQKEADELKNRHTQLIDKQQRLFAQMKTGGIDVRKLADESRRLATQQIDAAQAADKLKAKLEAQNKTLSRMHAAKANYDRTMATSSRWRDSGMAAAGAGAAIGLPVAKATKDYATFEEAMLGVARQVEGARDANGKLTATYHDMGRSIKEMSERIPMATTEIARIVEAGARMGIQGKQNLLIYTETTAVMAEAFQLPVEQIGDQIGKISNLYKIPIKDIKGLGDTINWLDDNALSKGGDIIDVMQRIAGSATMVNMNFKEAAALGSTFLSLGAGAEVAASASNAMIRELSIATMQTKRFRGGLEMLKLDAKAIQFGMSKDSTGTILKVLEAIKALPQEQQLEAATRLFGKEFGDDASKLAQNLGEYRRQLELVNAESAKGSMQREADARKETLNARLKMAQNVLFNLSSDLGEHLKPALVETLEKTNAIIQAVRNWARENPGFAAGLMTAVKWLALLGTGIGALLIAIGGIMIPLAAMKFALATLGIAGVTGAVIAGIKALGMAVLMSPLGPWALMIGVAAAVIYAKWGPLKEFFGSVVDYWGEKFRNFHAFVQSMPERFRTAGGQMIDGLIAGIQQRWQALKDTVGNVADSTVGWLRDKLGIRSPSRVFAEIGGFTMEGLEQGILRGQDGPLGALAKAAKGVAAAGAGMLVSGAAMAGPGIDTRPPLGMGGGMGGGGGNTYIFQIHPAPGMNINDLAGEIERKIRQLDAEKAARSRSRLADRE